MYPNAFWSKNRVTDELVIFLLMFPAMICIESDANEMTLLSSVLGWHAEHFCAWNPILAKSFYMSLEDVGIV